MNPSYLLHLVWKVNEKEDFFHNLQKIIKNETVFYSLIYKFSKSSTLFENR